MKAIVLAAGKGKRLQSEKADLPKVLRKANGYALIDYALENISFISQEDTVIVVGYKEHQVKKYLKGKYQFASQQEQLGTGHAVMMAEDILKDFQGNVLVIYGDMPLFTRNTFENFVKVHKNADAPCTIMTAIVDCPPDYGRIIRAADGTLVDVVEVRDCNEEQIRINEINVGVYVFDSKVLFENLKKLKNNNQQKEYYLTDVPKILLSQRIKVNTFVLENVEEIYGVNTIEDLEYCESVLKKREAV